MDAAKIAAYNRSSKIFNQLGLGDDLAAASGGVTPFVPIACRFRPVEQGFTGVGNYNGLDADGNEILFAPGTILTRYFYVILEEFHSAGDLATFGFGGELADDLSAGQFTMGAPVGLSEFPASSLIGGVSKPLTINVSVEALTSGKMDLYLWTLPPLTA